MLFDFLFSDFSVSRLFPLPSAFIVQTFSLSKESVLTSMDGEEIGD